MAKKLLTDKLVRSLRTTLRQEDFWDSSFKMKGAQFGVRVYSSGRKEYFIRYRTQNGGRPAKNLGDVSVICLADARQEARKLVGQVYNGGDPAAERDAIRASRTFQELFEEFIKFMEQKVASDNRRNSTVTEYKRLLKIEVLPSFGYRKICDITKADIIALLQHMEGERQCVAQARKLRALLHRIFKFAVERALLSASPCSDLPTGEKAKPRSRFLSEEEIPFLWSATLSVSDSMAMVYRLILLTGQRPGEVSGMRWSEIKDGIWTIPGSRVKNKRDQVVPLSTYAQELLSNWKRVLIKRWTRNMREGRMINRDLVFPARHATGPTRYINKTCRKMVTREELAKFTPHDLRRTAATHIRRLGFGRDTISQILNHAVQGVLVHYDHYQGLKEKQQALQAWGEEVRKLVTNSTKKEAVG